MDHKDHIIIDIYDDEHNEKASIKRSTMRIARIIIGTIFGIAVFYGSYCHVNAGSNSRGLKTVSMKIQNGWSVVPESSQSKPVDIQVNASDLDGTLANFHSDVLSKPGFEDFVEVKDLFPIRYDERMIPYNSMYYGWAHLFEIKEILGKGEELKPDAIILLGAGGKPEAGCASKWCNVM